MKKVLIGLFVCLALSSLILIQGAGETQGSGNPVTTQADTSLQTQNSGEASELQNQVQEQLRLQEGNYLSESGAQLQVQARENNRLEIRAGNSKAETELEINSEQTAEGKTKLKVSLSNGRNAEVKIMPDTASETALEQLRLRVCTEENNCVIELKQVGQGEQAKLAYEVQAERHAKLFGLFRTKLQVRAQIDAENGEVIQTKKPWWAFLTVDAETEVEAVV